MGASGKSWGGCQLKADPELTQHLEGVHVVNIEVLANVRYRDSFLDCPVSKLPGLLR